MVARVGGTRGWLTRRRRRGASWGRVRQSVGVDTVKAAAQKAEAEAPHHHLKIITPSDGDCLVYYYYSIIIIIINQWGRTEGACGAHGALALHPAPACLTRVHASIITHHCSFSPSFTNDIITKYDGHALNERQLLECSSLERLPQLGVITD